LYLRTATISFFLSSIFVGALFVMRIKEKIHLAVTRPGVWSCFTLRLLLFLTKKSLYVLNSKAVLLSEMAGWPRKKANVRAG
jgi:hypothetical protein